MTKVFLDAGHGGHDSGAVGNGLREKDIALEVTLKVGAILKKYNIDIRYSRSDNRFIELSERARMANSFNADVFVSIHCNSFSNANAKGTETYHFPNTKTGGDILAKSIHNSIVSDKLYTANRGVKSANFAVLRLTRMKSCLVELAFISNTDDANILKHKQNELSESIAKGILKNLGIKHQATDLKPVVKEIETHNKVKLKINGEIVEVNGFVKDNMNYVPVRIVERLGHKVYWDNESKTVVIK